MTGVQADRHSLWIPLKPIEEEPDPEKAQKMDEMIAILRIVSLLFPDPRKYQLIRVFDLDRVGVRQTVSLGFPRMDARARSRSRHCHRRYQDVKNGA